MRWLLAERYGWTLEYIDALSMDVLQQEGQVRDGIARFQKYEQERQRMKRR